MRADGDGRYCERCRLRVTEVAKLDDAGLEELISNSESVRVCARFELDRGRPRTAVGLAAGLVVVALAGCAGQVGEQPALVEASDGDVGREGGVIVGRITTAEGRRVENALIVLEGAALAAPLERFSNHRGAYRFSKLPSGPYTIRVLAGNADVSQDLWLGEDRRSKANFAIVPEFRDIQILVGFLVIDPPDGA